MSLESLLDQFDSLADRSTNIAGIRKLLIINVIKRATSRKGFLDRAVEVKASLTPQTKTKVGKSTGTRNQDLALPEVLLKIPTDAFARLGDVAQIEKGLTAIQKSKPGSYPLVVTAEARSTNATFDFEGPAVVIPMVSSTGHGHASLKRIHYQEGKFAAGNILSVVKPKRPDILNTRFLYEYLTAFKEELLVSRMVGTANVSLTINGLRDIPIPLIQGEDVAKVDELMALCDRLEAQLKERDVKQAALAKAALAKFTDDPTPENLQLLFHPSFMIEPDNLRKAVLNLATSGALITGQETLPGNKLGDHVEFLNGYAFKSQWFKESGIKLCRNINVGHGSCVWKEAAHVEQTVADEFKRFELKKGDIVLSLDRPLISTGLKIARIREADLPCLLLQRVARPTPKHADLDLDFLFLWFMSPKFTDSIDPGRSNGVPHISTSQLLDLEFRVPKIEGQRSTVEKVSLLLTIISKLEAQLEASRTTGEKLLEAMVAELTAA